MGLELLDNPELWATLFYPRPAQPAFDGSNGIYDGTIPVEGDVVLGYRFYAQQKPTPVVVYFHGNGEITTDYDGIYPEFRDVGLSLLVVDFRGYGWSTGQPTMTTLLNDVEAVYKALPSIMERAGVSDSPCYLMGRSLGSGPAIHLASSHPNVFKGLIIESGFADVTPLLVRRGFPMELLAGQPDPVGNVRKIQALSMPLFVIHGEDDRLLSVSNGQQLYDVSNAAIKRIYRIRRAGHNDLLWIGREQYFSAIADFVRLTQTNDEN